MLLRYVGMCWFNKVKWVNHKLTHFTSNQDVSHYTLNQNKKQVASNGFFRRSRLSMDQNSNGVNKSELKAPRANVRAGSGARNGKNIPRQRMASGCHHINPRPRSTC